MSRTASPGIVMLNEVKHLAGGRRMALHNDEILPSGQNDNVFDERRRCTTPGVVMLNEVKHLDDIQ